MNADALVIAAIDALESVGAPYMVVGSISSNVYAFPRSTEDADFVVQFQSGTLARILDILGPTFRLDSQAQFETVTATIRHIIHTPRAAFRIELFDLSSDSFDQERFSRRRRTRILGRSAFVPTAEDVVIQKLRWSQQGRRRKDCDDATNVIASQGSSLDWPYIERWCDEHGTRKLLAEIRASLPSFD